MDAVQLAKRDHKTIQRLFDKLVKTKGTFQREQLLAQLGEEIKVHSSIEEEILYPAFHETMRQREVHTYYEAREEHHIIDLVLGELQNVPINSERFIAKTALCQEIVKHHIREEERHMLARMQKKMGKRELINLGERMQERRERLMHGLDFDYGTARTAAYAARRIR